MTTPNRPWYTERYIHTQLHGDPVWANRIREEGTDRVIAMNIVKLEAEMICAHMNQVLRESLAH